MINPTFGRVRNPCDDCWDGHCTMNCSGAEKMPEDGTTTQQAWKVWVRIGIGPHGDFIEDITIYDCANKSGYVRGVVTLDAPGAALAGKEG